MRRFLSIFLCFILLLSICPVSFAVIDLSPLQGSDLFSIDIDEDTDSAFVTTTLTLSDRAFHHKRDSPFLNSNTQFDILLVNYSKAAYPVFRLWINYVADEINNITGVTFTLDGKRYSFSGIAGSDRQYDLDVCTLESLLVRFGNDNSEFLSALLSYSQKFFNDDLTTQNLDQVSIPLTLHGDEVIETTLNGNFLLDFMAIASALASIGDTSVLGNANATPMKGSDAFSSSGSAESGIPTDFIFLSGEIYVEALGDKLNGPSVDSSKVKLTLGDKTVRDGIFVDLEYFGYTYHGIVNGGRITWDKQPAIAADSEDMYTEISNQGNFVVIDFHFKTGGIWMINEHIYKAK